MSDKAPSYSDLAVLFDNERTSAFIFAKVPKDYDALDLAASDTDTNEQTNKQLEKVVISAPNARLWSGVAVATGMALVPASVIAPTAAALTQGVIMVGLAVMLAARNKMGKVVQFVQQEYITEHGSIKDKARNTQLQEKYTALKTKRDRRLMYGQVLIGGSLVSTIVSNTHSTGSSVLMTAGFCALSVALINHTRLKWNAGKSLDMVQTIAKRRGELVEDAPTPTKAPSP